MIRLNAVTICAAFGTLRELCYAAVGWEDKQFIALAKLLPLCKKCGRMDLGCNRCGDAGVIALADSLRGRDAFGSIELQGNAIGDAGALHLAKVRACRPSPAPHPMRQLT